MLFNAAKSLQVCCVAPSKSHCLSEPYLVPYLPQLTLLEAWLAVAHSCAPSIPQVEAGGSSVQGQLWQHKFKANVAINKDLMKEEEL